MRYGVRVQKVLALFLLFPLVARRAARLDMGKSTSTVRVPWQGTSCVPCQVELRSRHIESGSAGPPAEQWARHRGGLPLVTFLGRARKVTSRRAAPGLFLLLIATRALPL